MNTPDSEEPRSPRSPNEEQVVSHIEEERGDPSEEAGEVKDSRLERSPLPIRRETKSDSTNYSEARSRSRSFRQGRDYRVSDPNSPVSRRGQTEYRSSVSPGRGRSPAAARYDNGGPRRRYQHSPSARSRSRSPNDHSVAVPPPPAALHGHRQPEYYNDRRIRSPRSRSRSYGRRLSRSPARRPRIENDLPPQRGRRFPRGATQEERENPPVGRILGCFGLSRMTGERDLYGIFDRYGPVEKITLIKDRRTGISKGFAFIYFAYERDAVDAKEANQALVLHDRKVRVDFSVTKRAHSPTPGRYMGRRDRQNERSPFHRERAPMRRDHLPLPGDSDYRRFNHNGYDDSGVSGSSGSDFPPPPPAAANQSAHDGGRHWRSPEASYRRPYDSDYPPPRQRASPVRDGSRYARSNQNLNNNVHNHHNVGGGPPAHHNYGGYNDHHSYPPRGDGYGFKGGSGGGRRRSVSYSRSRSRGRRQSSYSPNRTRSPGYRRH